MNKNMFDMQIVKATDWRTFVLLYICSQITNAQECNDFEPENFIKIYRQMNLYLTFLILLYEGKLGLS